MSFNSFEYIIFLLLIVGVYWTLRRVYLQNILLLIGSYYFYARWDWRFLSLILISTLVDYAVGMLLLRTNHIHKRRGLLLISVMVNLGILGFFKYYNFFVESFVDLLHVIGIQAHNTTLQIILPVGISFYTFQTLSYTIDVYRKELAPRRNLLNFALFVSFFPQLVAGPIERASRLLPQIETPRSITPKDIESGLLLILLGLFKKIAIADVAAVLIDSQAFTTPSSVIPAIVLKSVYLFAIQIYADFSAYSDIARGSARLLGFDLMENFNQPYFAQTITEFWRRWHISLSTWLRDYVYIPLNNGIRRITQRQWLVYSAAVMGTMFLSGLWHGANYTFILWGLLLGLFQVLQRWFQGAADKWINHKSRTIRHTVVVVRVVFTFHLVLVSWVLFRTPTIRYVPDVYRSMAVAMLKGEVFNGIIMWPVWALYGLVLFIDIWQVKSQEHAFTMVFQRPVRIALYTFSLLMMTYFTLKPYVPFIYFKF